MSAGQEDFKDQLQVDTNSLYREETITDMKSASFKIMTPIKIDGTDDDTREKFISAHTSVMSPMGVIPLQAKLEATNLEEAAKEFPDAIQKAMDKLVEDAREMQRQEASKIVVPGAAPQSNKIHLG